MERDAVVAVDFRLGFQPDGFEVAVAVLSNQQFPSVGYVGRREFSEAEMPRYTLLQGEGPSTKPVGHRPIRGKGGDGLGRQFLVLDQGFAIRVVLDQVGPRSDPDAVAFIEGRCVGHPHPLNLGFY